MKGASVWGLRVGLALLPLALAYIAVPRIIDGIALERAFPVPVYLEMNNALPRATYARAAEALERGDQGDGERAIFEAEARENAGGDRDQDLAILRKGLALSPATPRGWVTLAELLTPVDRQKAAGALSVGLTLAPSDYLLLFRQEREAGILWDVLPEDARRVAADAAPTLWSEEPLHKYIRPVLQTPGGAALMSEGFKFEPNELRAMNRWVTERRLEEQREQ